MYLAEKKEEGSDQEELKTDITSYADALWWGVVSCDSYLVQQCKWYVNYFSICYGFWLECPIPQDIWECFEIIELIIIVYKLL